MKFQLRTGRDNMTNTEVIGTYCSTEANPGSITTKFNTLYLDFVSDISVAYGGFRMEWTVHGRIGLICTYTYLKMFITGCGGKFDAKNNLNFTHVQSPNYPHNYPVNTECMWEISTGWGQSVALTIMEFSLESSNNCLSDYMKVHNSTCILVLKNYSFFQGFQWSRQECSCDIELVRKSQKPDDGDVNGQIYDYLL